jgi:hypothetical protein
MTIEQRGGLPVYSGSVVEHAGTTYFLAVDGGLGIAGDTDGFDGMPHPASGAFLCPLTARNAAALRDRLPWLNPAPLGVRTSAGFGDRLGLATPGHVQAVRGTGIAPIFAQQSVRENMRTGRTPQQVLDDAMWGVFQMGWREAWGADADHLKTPDVIQEFVTAGYTFYTVDPGDHVDNRAEVDPLPVLTEKMKSLPWDVLDSSPDDLHRRLLGSSIAAGCDQFVFDEEKLRRAAAKYGRAVAHIVVMYRHLAGLMGGRPFDFEVSVDETETPTSILEHVYIASELARLGVQWTSLAPRFVGRFEKGVDYIGDQAELYANLTGHAAVMRCFGPYKISLHSGSDKFSVYDKVFQTAGGHVHLKTAGTSYLEALRVIAQVDPALFREILSLARARYNQDRATYHVSARLENVPAAETLSDLELPGLLDQFDVRQVLHVTYGSALDRFGIPLRVALEQHAALYANTLAGHFSRHLAPFR